MSNVNFCKIKVAVLGQSYVQCQAKVTALGQGHVRDRMKAIVSHGRVQSQMKVTLQGQPS